MAYDINNPDGSTFFYTLPLARCNENTKIEFYTSEKSLNNEFGGIDFTEPYQVKVLDTELDLDNGQREGLELMLRREIRDRLADETKLDFSAMRIEFGYESIQ